MTIMKRWLIVTRRKRRKKKEKECFGIWGVDQCRVGAPSGRTE